MATLPPLVRFVTTAAAWRARVQLRRFDDRRRAEPSRSDDAEAGGDCRPSGRRLLSSPPRKMSGVVKAGMSLRGAGAGGDALGGRRRVCSGLFFFPRGGSAQVARALSRVLPPSGWQVALASGSLGEPGAPTHAG